MKQYNKIKSTVKMFIFILRFVYLYIFSIYYIWNDFLLDVIFVYYAELILTHFNEFRFFINFPFYQCQSFLFARFSICSHFCS